MFQIRRGGTVLINETCPAPSICPCWCSHRSEIRLSGSCSGPVWRHILLQLLASQVVVPPRALIRECWEKEAAKWSSSHLRWRTHPLCQETLHIWFFIYISVPCDTRGGNKVGQWTDLQKPTLKHPCCLSLVKHSFVSESPVPITH